MREMREKRLLATAEKMLASGACEQFTVNELANAAGVAKGTVYTHFRSQDDLLKMVLSRVSAQLIARLQTCPAGSVLERLETSLSVVATEIADRTRGHLGYPCCLTRSPCPYRGSCELEAMLRDMIEDVRTEGAGVREIDANQASGLFVSMLSAVAHRHQNVAEAKRDLLVVCELFLYGLLGSRASGASPQK